MNAMWRAFLLSAGALAFVIYFYVGPFIRKWRIFPVHYVDRSIEIKPELDRFIEQAKALDKNDLLFQQRVYTLVGLVICPNPQEKMGHVFW